MDSNRDKKGRFTQGNKAGRGRPIGSRIDTLRRALILSLTKERLENILNALYLKAEQGDIAAIKLIFERVFGQPIALDIIERKGEIQTIENTEKRVERENQNSVLDEILSIDTYGERGL